MTFVEGGIRELTGDEIAVVSGGTMTKSNPVREVLIQIDRVVDCVHTPLARLVDKVVDCLLQGGRRSV